MKTIPAKPTFTELRYKQREAAGLCRLCDEPLASKNFCLAHALRMRERNRLRKSSKVRYNSAVERMAKAPKHIAIVRQRNLALKALRAFYLQLRSILTA